MKSYLNLSVCDYANFAHDNARALRAVGANVMDLKFSKHQLGYKTESSVVNERLIKDVYMDYDVLQLFHSNRYLFELVKDHPNIVVYHTGTAYRNDHVRLNELFNPVVKCCITDQTEFMELGAKNLHYIAPHTELKPAPKRQDGKLIIGHFPSNHWVKGTDQIIYLLEQHKDDFEIRIDKTLVSHEENLRRTAQCHIYIELFKPVLDGRPYGAFGTSAFEAAALGCLVITQDFHPEVYKSVYGSCSFAIANTEAQFFWLLDFLKKCKPSDLITKGEFYKKHDIKATGERILTLTQ